MVILVIWIVPVMWVILVIPAWLAMSVSSVIFATPVMPVISVIMFQ